MSHPANCLNCETPLHTEYKFCYKCGQPTNTHKRITMGHIAHEVFHAFTHADKGFLYLIKALFTQPGTTIREYLDGRHKKYFNPFSFFFIVLGVYVLSNAFFKPFDRVKSMTDEQQHMVYPASVKTPEQRAKYKARYEMISKRSSAVMNFMNTKTNIVLGISTPFIALIMLLLYWRSVNYAENLVVMTFVNSVLNLLSIFIFTPLMHFVPNPDLYQIIVWVMLFIHAAYIAIVYHGVAKQKNTFFGVSKSILTGAIAIGGWLFISFTIIRFYILYPLWH